MAAADRRAAALCTAMVGAARRHPPSDVESREYVCSGCATVCVLGDPPQRVLRGSSSFLSTRVFGSICTRVVVMAQGRVLCEGPPDRVVRDPRVIEAYLGGAVP
jgi:hypothetical protein